MADGDRIECGKDSNLFQITKMLGEGRRQVSFDNQNKDLMFSISLELQSPEGVEIAAEDKAKVEGPGVDGNPAKYKLTLYPFESSAFLVGKWKGQKKGLAGAGPDAAWREKKAKELNGAVTTEFNALTDAVKAAGLDPKNPHDVATVCIQKRMKYIDLTFPPDATSLCRPHEAQISIAPWMRPSVYCGDKEACLYVGAIEPEDIDQGQLGDCYFMCALACLSEFPDLVKATYRLPQYPELGMYRARLCKDGWWEPVILDDFLPVNPASKLPLFAKNREEPEELWVSILEKAYAKVNGSFAAIKAGDPAQAVADMVGGPYEKFNPQEGTQEEKDKLFDLLAHSDDNDHIMCLGTPGVDTTQSGAGAGGSVADLAEKYKAVGLCTGHAFSLIRVKKTSQGHKLVMIRNPWGNDIEWNGDWSDDSKLWTDDIKKEVGFYAADDGTFWMAWHDVCQWFNAGSVTYVLTETHGWSQARVRSSFDKGVPKVLLQIDMTGETDSWIGAHQKDTRGTEKGTEANKYLGILFTVLKKNDQTGKLERFASTKSPEAFQSNRDQFIHTTMTPGKYYVLAQGYQDFTRDFTVSIFAHDHTHMKIQVMSYTDAAVGKKFNPSTKFQESFCQPAAKEDVLYQVVTKAHEVVIWGKQLDPVIDWNIKPTQEQQEEIVTRIARQKQFDAKLTGGLGAGAIPKTAGGGGAPAPAASAPAPKQAAPSKQPAPSTATGTKSQSPKPQSGSQSPKPQSGSQSPKAPEYVPSDSDIQEVRQKAGGQHWEHSYTKNQAIVALHKTKGDIIEAVIELQGTPAAQVPKENEVQCEGYLEKYAMGRSGLKSFMPGSSNWKRRYFKLYTDGQLAYYEDIKKASAGDAKHILKITKETSAMCAKPTKKHHPEVKESKVGDIVIAIQDGDKKDSRSMLLLRCSDENCHKDWCNALTVHTKPIV